MLDFVTGGISDIYSGQFVFDGVNVDVSTGGLLPATADFTLTIDFVPYSISTGIYGSLDSGDAGRHVIQIDASGNIFAFFAGGGAMTTANAVNLNELNTVVLSRSGSNFSLTLNGGTAATATGSPTLDTAGSNIGDPYSGGNYKGIITSFEVGATTWDGTESDATSNGWTVNGSPQTLNGYVSTWYDQSGNDNNATQPTTTSQPKIVEAGTLVTGGLDFYSNSFLESAAFADGTSSSVFMAFNNQAADANRKIFFSKSAFATSGVIVNYRGDNSVGQYDFVSYDGTTRSLTYSEATSPLLGLSTTIINGTGKEAFLNGTSRASDAEAFVGGNTVLRLGSTGFGTGFEIAEAILYPSDETANRVGIETNINNHYSIYA
jgi:hypothetical protein